MPPSAYRMAPTAAGAGRGLMAESEAWLKAFHEGERSSMEACYREHFDTFDRAVRTVVQGADRETLVHEVFARLLAEEPLRRAFSGGSFGAWLRTVARNQAIDYARRRRLEVSLPEEGAVVDTDAGVRLERQVDVRLTLARLRQSTSNGTTGGGQMFYLVAGPSGPVRGSGFAYQLTYDISGDDHTSQLNMRPAPNSNFGGSVRYSPCPTELEITVDFTHSTLVRFR